MKDFDFKNPKPVPAGVQFLLDKHFEWLLPNKKNQTLIKDWMAFTIRYPLKRINYAIFLQGAQGCGKSYLCNLLSTVLGPSNVKSLSIDNIEKKYTDWAYKCKVAVIEEIKASGHNRWQLMDRLKPFITNDTVTIRGVYEKPFTNRNVMNIMGFSNFDDMVAIDDDDRRYCILKCFAQTKEQVATLPKNYFKELNQILEDPTGCTQYFLNYKISDSFDNYGRAPRTQFTEMVEELSKSESQEFLEDHIESDASDPLCNDRLISVRRAFELLNSEILTPSPIKTPRWAIPATLQSMKYTWFKRVSIKGERHSIWTKIGANQDEIPKLLEEINKEK
jgi:energy-coupling factor transporter ATP-binding protein EcfA2